MLPLSACPSCTCCVLVVGIHLSLSGMPPDSKPSPTFQKQLGSGRHTAMQKQKPTMMPEPTCRVLRNTNSELLPLCCEHPHHAVPRTDIIGELFKARLAAVLQRRGLQYRVLEFID